MDEEQYTKGTIIPLLKHLGYMEVTYNHGIKEFGKDVVFSEYDRFGNKIYHAAQIKHGDISGSNQSQINDLINHIQNAFHMNFPDLISQEEVAISHFFLMISGNFVGNARDKLMKDTRLTIYRHRLHFYEGHHIQELFEKNFRDVKELCMAQIEEIQYNTGLAYSIKQLLNMGRIQYINFVSQNIPQLLQKLSTFDSENDLKVYLRQYHQWVLRNNNMTGLIPILDPIMGAERETKFLRVGIEEMLVLGNMVEDGLKKALSRLAEQVHPTTSL